MSSSQNFWYVYSGHFIFEQLDVYPGLLMRVLKIPLFSSLPSEILSVSELAGGGAPAAMREEG